MKTRKFLLQPLALAALFAVSGASHAALTVFTNQASFVSTIAAVGVDDYRLTAPVIRGCLRASGSDPDFPRCHDK